MNGLNLRKNKRAIDEFEDSRLMIHWVARNWQSSALYNNSNDSAVC